MRPFLYAAIGFVAASILSWGGLFIWSSMVLERNDSYWDRTSMAADTFIACWLLFGNVTAIGAALWSRRRAERV